MTDTSKRPGPESTLDEVREQLIQAALDQLQVAGVEIGLGHIRLSDVIRATDHSRATAYRSLADEDDSPQAVLHKTVLMRLLRRDARAENRDSVMDAIALELNRLEHQLSSDDIAQRTYAMRSIIRVGAAASYHAVSESRTRSVLVAAYGALSSWPADDWRHEELRRGENHITELFGELYTGLSQIFGHQLKPEFSIKQFAAAAAAFVEGLAVRKKFSDELDGISRPSGLNGESEEWTLHGLGFEGMYMLFFEPIDKENPFADLRRY